MCYNTRIAITMILSVAFVSAFTVSASFACHFRTKRVYGCAVQVVICHGEFHGQLRSFRCDQATRIVGNYAVRTAACAIIA